jgi:hypothetical protein
MDIYAMQIYKKMFQTFQFIEIFLELLNYGPKEDAFILLCLVILLEYHVQ